MTLVYVIDSIAYKIQDTDFKPVTEVSHLTKVELLNADLAGEKPFKYGLIESFHQVAYH